jgi:hypothetical protein
MIVKNTSDKGDPSSSTYVCTSCFTIIFTSIMVLYLRYIPCIFHLLVLSLDN